MRLDTFFRPSQSELRMRADKVGLVLSLTVLGAFGQQAPTEPPSDKDPSPPAASRQQREKQIRMYDPLDKSSPLADQQNVPVDRPTAGAAQSNGQTDSKRKDSTRTDSAPRPLR